MKTIHHFSTAGHRDGPAQPKGNAGMAPQANTPSSGQAPARPTGAPTRLENHKPGSARPHAGSGGTRNMAQVSNAPASQIPMRGTGMLPRASRVTPGSGKGLGG